jgi:hypothetical protein
MKKGTFDCVEMKRQGAAVVLKKIKSMTREQELEYWRKRTQEMRNTQKQRPNRANKSKPTKPSIVKV